MLARPVTTGISPNLHIALARLLSSEQPLVARIAAMFEVLRGAIQFRDGRLIWWVQPAGEVARREEFSTVERLPYPWDEHFTDETIRRHAPGRAPVVLPSAPDNGHDGVAEQVTGYSAPVIWNDQLCGVIELRADGPEVVSADEQALLDVALPLLAAALAASSGGWVPAGLAEARDLTKRQEILITRLRQEFDASLALGPLLQLVLRWALDATGAEAGSISLVDYDRRELVVQVYDGYRHEPFQRDAYGETRRTWSWELGLTGQVARSGRAALLRDVQHDRDDTPDLPEIRARLAVPIVRDGRVLAVLVLDSPRSAAFGDGELAFARALCAAAAAPLYRAVWYQEAIETSMQLGRVFSNIPNGLALLDRQGKVLRYNPAWLSIWGVATIQPDQPFHVPWDLVPLLLHRLEDPLRLTEFYSDGQGNPAEPQTTTIMLREPNQELLVLAMPTRDSLGQLTGRLWVVTDVTREREADRLKSEFISIVSHELRTPLTSILGYTELLINRPFTPAEQKEFVQTVYDQALHLSQIVEDLLGMSRLDAGKVSLNQWVVSLRQIVNEVSSQLNAHLTSRHRMVIDMPPRTPPVFVDRDKVKQVLINLLTNAVKYSPRGGEITLRVEELFELPPEHPPGAFMLIQVRDQGMGIPPEDLPRIWERFYRVDNSNTRRIGGTGLGLAISRALVELHGGRIWADSAPGKGSIFSFTLPLATEAVPRGQ
jgi:signal transduction histidine kinase